jgi:hypothetical protein
MTGASVAIRRLTAGDGWRFTRGLAPDLRRGNRYQANHAHFISI